MGINLKITLDSIDSNFDRIAKELMNNWVLKVNETYYRITEIEFYYDHILQEIKSEGISKDPYTHRNEQQKKSGTWYFHGSGLDLTFGNEDYYGGILIRGIYKFDSNLEEKGKHISGPLNSITEILSSFGSCEMKSIEFGLIESAKVPTVELSKIEPIKAPRVGLNSSKDEIAHKKLFRFLIYPKETNKDKSLIIKTLVDQGVPQKEAEKLVYK